MNSTNIAGVVSSAGLVAAVIGSRIYTAVSERRRRRDRDHTHLIYKTLTPVTGARQQPTERRCQAIADTLTIHNNQPRRRQRHHTQETIVQLVAAIRTRPRPDTTELALRHIYEHAHTTPQFQTAALSHIDICDTFDRLGAGAPTWAQLTIDDPNPSLALNQLTRWARRATSSHIDTANAVVDNWAGTLTDLIATIERVEQQPANTATVSA